MTKKRLWIYGGLIGVLVLVKLLVDDGRRGEAPPSAYPGSMIIQPVKAGVALPDGRVPVTLRLEIVDPVYGETTIRCWVGADRHAVGRVTLNAGRDGWPAGHVLEAVVHVPVSGGTLPQGAKLNCD